MAALCRRPLDNQGRPNVNNPTNNGRGTRHLENHHRLTRSRIGHDEQSVTYNITPRATVAVFVPRKVDRPFLDRFPVPHLYCGMRSVDHNYGTAWNQVVHGVIIQADDAESKLTGIKALAHNCRHSQFFCALGYQSRLVEANAALK